MCEELRQAISCTEKQQMFQLWQCRPLKKDYCQRARFEDGQSSKGDTFSSTI